MLSAVSNLLIALSTTIPTTSSIPLRQLAPNDDLVLFVELQNGGALVDLALDSSTQAQLDSFPSWTEVRRSAPWRRAKGAVGLFAGLWDRPPAEALIDLLSREVAVAVSAVADDEYEGLILIRLQNEEDADRLVETVHELLEIFGSDEEYDNEGPIWTVNGREFHSSVGDVFLMSNRRQVVADAREKFLTALKSDDRDSAQFISDAVEGTAVLSAHLDVDAIRSYRDVRKLPETSDNALFVLLFRGLTGLVNEASTANARAELSSEGVRLEVNLNVPADRARDVRSESPWFFDTAGQSIQLDSPDGTIAALRVRRDFGDFYRRRFEIFPDRVEKKLIQFENIASNLFSGHSIGDEVLPMLGKEALLIVKEQSYQDIPSPPAIQIPSFTLVIPTNEGQFRGDDFLLAFQSAIGVVNFDRANNGMDGLMLGFDQQDDVQVCSARFLTRSDEPEMGMRYNTTPTIAIGSGYLAIGSTREGVVDVVSAITSTGTLEAQTEPANNSSLLLDLSATSDALAANRDSLVADRMIEEGESLTEAAVEIDRFIRILDLANTLSISLEHSDSGILVDFKIGECAADSEERS